MVVVVAWAAADTAMEVMECLLPRERMRILMAYAAGHGTCAV